MNTKHVMMTVALALLAMAPMATAEDYDFNGFTVDVEAWAGSGSNETILVVDWNRLDTGTATISESHAFGYRWDGTAYELDMMIALDGGGILDVTTSTFGAQVFLTNIAYDGAADGETHLHIEPGSWNMGSTTDPHARWGAWGDSEWDFNGGGMEAELLADGQFEGACALYFGDPLTYTYDDQVDIPVPEPVSVSLLGFGALALLRRRRRS